MSNVAKHPVLGTVHVLSTSGQKARVKATGYGCVPYRVPLKSLNFIHERRASNEPNAAKSVQQSAREVCTVS